LREDCRENKKKYF